MTHRFLKAVLAASICLLFSDQVLPVNADRTIDLSTSAGVAWQFQPENGAWSPIRVPDGGWKTQGYSCDAGTYKAVISIPNFSANQRVLLDFDAINFGGRVQVGSDASHLTEVANHVDGWVPVTADITDDVISGKPALLVVDVAGRAKFKRNGKYIVPEGATWCSTLEDGILRGVHLRVVPAIRVSDIFVQPSVESRTLRTTVQITNSTNLSANVQLTGSLSSWNSAPFAYPRITAQLVTVAAQSKVSVAIAPVAWKLGPTSYWWPNVPYKSGYRAKLHILTVHLTKNGQTLDTSTARFGFRQFAAHGTHYYLNGIRCNLRGDNLQEANFGIDAYGIKPGFGAPSATNPGWPKAVDNLEHLNFNVMRIHQIPATPYMLDTCDEMGLMLIEESPLRGSEGGEDFQGGHDNMLNMDRELVLRDRNHPSTIIWSAANEWGDPIAEAVPAINQVDGTRPVIADGCGDPGPQFIFMQHYVNGIGGLPSSGAKPQPDRPFGEGEAIWPADNTLQGFAWMATGTLQRRLKNNADIRNYTLNNAWPNFIPGESPSTEICKKRSRTWAATWTFCPLLPIRGTTNISN